MIICGYKTKHKLLSSEKYLKGKSLDTILYAQKKATENVFEKKKIPFRSFEIKKRDEKSLGELFCFFILETILLGKALKLNPYFQKLRENKVEKLNNLKFLNYLTEALKNHFVFPLLGLDEKILENT